MSPEELRKEQGLSLVQMAEKIRICPAYLRRIELHGKAPWMVAQRMAKHYKADRMEIFLRAWPKKKADAKTTGTTHT